MLQNALFGPPPKVYGIDLSLPFSQAPSVFHSIQNPSQENQWDPSIKVCFDCTLFLAHRQFSDLAAGFQCERDISALDCSTRSGCPLCRALLQKFRPTVASRLRLPVSVINAGETNLKLFVRVDSLGRDASLIFKDLEQQEKELSYHIIRRNGSSRYKQLSSTEIND